MEMLMVQESLVRTPCRPFLDHRDRVHLYRHDPFLGHLFRPLGAIAGAKKAELISVLVADETKRIDAAVTAGKLTAEQATTLKAGLTAHVTAEVDQVGGKGGPGMGRGDKGGRGHGGPGMGGMGAAPTIPAPSATPSA